MTEDDDTDLEVIDVEPADPPSSTRDDTRIATGVRRRRGPVLLGVVAVVALVGSAILSQSDDKGRGSTSTTRVGQADIALDKSPLFPFRVGAQVLTGGSDGLQLIDTDTGRRTVPPVSGLPEGRVTVVAASGGTVAVRVNASLYWFSMQERVARSFQGDIAFPAARRGHLWFAGPRFATEVPGAPHPIATTGQAIGATNGGLLFNTKAGVLLQSTGDPSIAPRLFLRAPVTVIGVHPERVAWVADDCGVLRCTVRVTEIAGEATSSWLQLTGRPNPLMLAGSSAMFSPDGNHLAIVVPDESVTSAKNLYLADLRSRATHAVYVRGRFDQPARPGSDDATGNTIDWTRDSRYLLLAPASGSGPIAAMDPVTGRIVPSRAPIGVISSAAAIGTSTVGPLDLARHGSNGPVDSGSPTTFDAGGLTLIGADDHRVDVIGLMGTKASTWPIATTAPHQTLGGFARVVGGWLVVRSFGSSPDDRTVVELLRDGGGEARELASGSQVFSADAGRRGWIVDPTRDLARSYDATTATPGLPFPLSGMAVGAVDTGLVTTGTPTTLGTALYLIDRSGRRQQGAFVSSTAIQVVAAAGTHVAIIAEVGLQLLDIASGTEQLITPLAAHDVTLSTDGSLLAWIGADPSDTTTDRVRVVRVGSTDITEIGGPADRVLVADDGTVLFTDGNELRRGRVDANGSDPVYGYAPDSDAALALGYDPPRPDINLGPNFLP